MFNKRLTLILILIMCITSIQVAQEVKEGSRHDFEIVTEIPTTPVKNQGRSGTCWAFATTSFIETELLRMGKPEFDLSEMYFVRNKLIAMGENYVRYHGKANFGQGGQAHDVFDAIRVGGMLTESVYSGKTLGKNYHDHGEFDSVLQGMLDAVLKKRSGLLTSKWKEAYTNVIDTYLGEVPDEVVINDKTTNAADFSNSTGFNPDDYVEITSYTHHPYYSKFVLELPDNWSSAGYYNLPIDELISVIDYAFENGYSVCWDGDSGKDNFYRKECYAVIPKEDVEDNGEPEEEKEISQEMRQETFDNFDVTDDHLMHLVGVAKNQNDTKFYLTKNSWGTENRKYDGYWYMSESYVRLKTIAIILHKDALPEEIKSKLEID